MNKEFIPYEQALELKELGFDDECFGVYYNPTQELFIGKTINPFTKEIRTFAPTYSQAFRWFREKYDLHSCLKLNYDILDSYILYINDTEINRFTIKNKKWESLKKTASFKKSKCYNTYTYKRAELECLNQLINFIKYK